MANEQLGFFTAVSYGECNQKYDSLREAIDHYFFWGDRKAVVIDGSKVVNGTYSVQLKEIPPQKLTLCKVLIKILQVISYIPFGLPALLIKWAIRPKFIIISPDSNSIIAAPNTKPEIQPHVFIGDKLTARNFPFDTPLLLTSEQFAATKLRILGSGEVDGDKTFKDSRIDVKYDTQKNIILTRRRFRITRVQLPILGNNQSSIPFDSYDLYSEEMLRCQSIAKYALKQIPQVLGRGCMGQVYSVEISQKEAAVFKLRNMDAGAREGQAFYPLRNKGNQENTRFKTYIDKRSNHNMDGSFCAAVSVVKALSQLPPSPHIPKCYGIVYIEEFNLWGPIYEKIEGSDLPDHYETIEKVKRIMKGVAEGLKLLDEHGHAYTDIDRSNIMVREIDETPVIVDDPVKDEPSRDPESSLSSRKKFGTLLYNALHGKDSPFYYNTSVPNREEIYKYREGKDKKLADLVCQCWSDKPMEEFGWDHILANLS